ncbi:hypothetical protein IJT17_07730 [bacterium]|nr:hypothetical protein [bacterium]
MNFLAKIGHRMSTAWDFTCWIGGMRPWILPILLGLLLLTGLVSLAQATHIAPFIYTLF